MAKVRGFVFACDDKTARKEASLLGVKLTGTIGILIRAVMKMIIDHKKANEMRSRRKAFSGPLHLLITNFLSSDYVSIMIYFNK
ncbi:MAG: hypothetical protein ACK4Z9_03485 [Thermodesulfovibrionales bacterium]